jgi:hypothetical protein
MDVTHPLGIPLSSPALYAILPGMNLQGIIKSIISPQHYLVELNGVLIDLLIPLELTEGQKIVLQAVKDTRSGLLKLKLKQLDIKTPLRLQVPDSPEDLPVLIRRLGLPDTKENLVITQQLLKMGIPVTRDAVQMILAAVSKVEGSVQAKVQAAVFLYSLGIRPTTSMLTTLQTRQINNPYLMLNQPVGAPGVEVGPQLATFDIKPDDPVHKWVQVFEEINRGGFILRVSESIHRVLEGLPSLRLLDDLIRVIDSELLSVLPQRPGSKSVELSSFLEDVQKTLGRITGDTFEQEAHRLVEVLRSIRLSSKEEVLQIRHALLRLEEREIQSDPTLNLIRDQGKDFMQFYERVANLRVLNQLSLLRQANVFYTEIPVQVEGKLQMFALKIYQREGKKGQQDSGEKGLILNVDMSQLGNVRVWVKWHPHRSDPAKRDLKVRFRLRDNRVKRLFEQHRAELKDALRAQGYEVSLAEDVVLSDVVDQHLLLDEEPAPPYISLDIRV